MLDKLFGSKKPSRPEAVAAGTVAVGDKIMQTA
jgi:hypothetical protein